MAQSYVRAADLPLVVPAFPLRGVILLPRSQLPLNIFEPRYLNMVDDAMAGDRIIAMIQPTGGSPAYPSLTPVGCAGRITSFAEASDGRYLITLTGVCRFRVAAELPSPSPYRQLRADFLPFEADLASPPENDTSERGGFLEALRAYLGTRGLDIDWDMAESAPTAALVNSLAMTLPFEPVEKQALLEASDLSGRTQTLLTLLRISAAADGDDVPPIQ